MTFEQFQATRKDCDNLGAFFGDARWDKDPAPGRGFLYVDALYIEKVADHWPDKAKAEGAFYLILGRCEWITNNLEDLERKLYAFAIGEGFAKMETRA